MIWGNWGTKCGFLSEYCSRDRGWGFITTKDGYGGGIFSEFSVLKQMDGNRIII
jgi:hypothetical protein